MWNIPYLWVKYGVDQCESPSQLANCYSHPFILNIAIVWFENVPNMGLQPLLNHGFWAFIRRMGFIYSKHLEKMRGEDFKQLGGASNVRWTTMSDFFQTCIRVVLKNIITDHELSINMNVIICQTFFDRIIITMPMYFSF